MKQRYPKVPLFLAFFTLIFYLPKPLLAQCMCSGGMPALTEQHTVTTTFSSNSTTLLSMPKFNAATGLLICVNSKIYLTSVLRMRLENDEAFAINYTARYQRKDTFSGPGINPNVVGTRNRDYGPYTLAGSDGNPFAGPDFKSIGPDSIYNKVLYQASTTDVIDYLGTGTVDFYYKSIVNTFATGSDVYALAVTSVNKVDFTVTYSYCTQSMLPINITNFQVDQKDNNDVFVSWMIQNETKANNYEIEVSENGAQFYSIGSKKAVADATTAKYDYQYHFDKPLAGVIYFRIKQVEGKTTSYSEIRTIHVGNAATPVMNLYPNPVVRNINMEFDEPETGEFSIELANQVGQIVLSKKVKLFNNMRYELMINDPPPTGVYFLRARKSGSSKVYSGKLLFRR